MGEESPIPSLTSRIASLVHSHFDALPTRSKPTVHPDGSREWIPMSAIVAVKGENTPTEKVTCVAITTGAKCLSSSQIPQCRGLVLHDSHAEILAIRAFNYWLLNECRGILAHEERATGLASEPTTSQESNAEPPFVRRRPSSTEESKESTWPPFEICPDIKLYMYCTCAPCGDASMELCMAAQEDATPWEITTPKPQSQTQTQSQDQSTDPSNSPSVNNTTDILLDGRAHFSLLGVVRRKPARMDAESTRSKSCSDKLALRQVSSLLSYETSLLVAPTRNVYLEGIILPEEEISQVGCERSFSERGRMKALSGRFWPEETIKAGEDDQKYGYRFQPFKILSVPNEQIESLWPFAKPKPTSTTSKKSKPGNVSAIWTIASTFPPPPLLTLDNGSKALPTLRGSKMGLYETVINGVKQGNKASAPLARGASALSRARSWGLLRDVLNQAEENGGSTDTTGENTLVVDGTIILMNEDLQRRIVESTTYEEFKRAAQSFTGTVQSRGQAIQDARRVLNGWAPNSGDETWGLDVLVDPKKRKR